LWTLFMSFVSVVFQLTFLTDICFDIILITTGKMLGSFTGKCSGSIRSIVRHPDLPVVASCGEQYSVFSLVRFKWFEVIQTVLWRSLDRNFWIVHFKFLLVYLEPNFSFLLPCPPWAWFHLKLLKFYRACSYFKIKWCHFFGLKKYIKLLFLLTDFAVSTNSTHIIYIF
jgi:hypothetical protein